MNQLKRVLGLMWMALAVLLVFFMFYQAWDKVQLAPAGFLRTNTLLQWIIILLVFIPICVGLFIFGKYAWTNQYDHLPVSSDDDL